MPQCAFRNCRNNYRKCKLADGISYFRFPNNPYRAAKWVAIVATERSEEFYKPTKNSVICSEHFDSKDIIGNTERRRLDKTAVPKFKIQSIPPGELTVRKKSKTRYKIQKTKLHELETEVVVDSERTSCDDHDVPPSSPSTSTSENETLPELLNVEYLQNKLKKCRKIIQDQSTTIGNLKKINKKLEDKNNTLKNTIDFLLNHYESNTIGKHFLQNFD